MPTLDEQAVKSWLQGQRMATQRMEAERTARLLTLTPEESLRTYLELQPDPLSSPEPSPVLIAMRRLLGLYFL